MATERDLVAQDLRLIEKLPPLPCPTKPYSTGEDSVILVTGASGFLGRYLVLKLLENPKRRVLCLIRASSQNEAQIKLLGSLQLADAKLTALPERVAVVRGALSSPHFGLTEDIYHNLAAMVDMVYHCAGEVNWVRSYRHLRLSNVIGSMQVLGFAADVKVKRCIFFSSLAVCFIPDGPPKVDEQSDYLPYLDRMAMGYAKSKCVAEELFKHAAKRGLPVTIFRVGLIAGDSVSGASNPTDLLAAMIQGAVHSRSAIDADWLIDVLPVDFVVSAALALSENPSAETNKTLQVIHLNHPHPRHWREIVLWLNLYGYDINLLTTEPWLEQTFLNRPDTDNPLYAFKRFFCEPLQQEWVSNAPRKPAAKAVQLRAFETYLASAQRKISSHDSQQLMHPMQAPALDSSLIHRYLAHYQSTNKLHKLARLSKSTEPILSHADLLDQKLEAMLQLHYRAPQLEILNIRRVAFQAHNGILNEISAASVSSQAGIRVLGLSFRRCVSCAVEQIQVLVKTKLSDSAMQTHLARGAALCDKQIGEYFLQYPNSLGLQNAHLRELALYQWQQADMRAQTPHCYGVLNDPERGYWSVVLAYVEQIDSSELGLTEYDWTSKRNQNCSAGLARIHGIAYSKIASLPSSLYLSPMHTQEQICDMLDMLRKISRFSAQYFSEWLGYSLLPLQEKLLASLPVWWPQVLAMPHALIHNDFNPRNFQLLEQPSDPTEHGADKLCVFDWELAGIGLPQQDLAEMLCFTLPKHCTKTALLGYIEDHRLAVQQHSGVAIDSAVWHRGMVLALQHLIINRLPSYTLFHRFKPQTFLPTVIANWVHMFELLTGKMETGARSNRTLASELKSHPKNYPYDAAELQNSRV